MASLGEYPKSDSDRQINRAILDGNKRAENVLANKYFEEIKKNIKKRRLFRDLVHKGNLNEMDADDIAMKVWDVFAEKLKREWIRAKLRTYYSSLVFRILMGFYRIALKRGFKEPLDLNAYTVNDKGDVILREPKDLKKEKELDTLDKITIILVTFRDNIKPIHFMILCLRYYENMKNKEVASVVGYSEPRITQIKNKVLLRDIPKLIVESELTDKEIYEDGLQKLPDFAS